MYLYCTKCLHATAQERWGLSLFKYGTCPSCGCSGYKTAVEWLSIAEVNGHPDIPDPGQVYAMHPVLF